MSVGAIVNLRDLVDGLPLVWEGAAAAEEVEVTGVCHDSRRVAAGDLFVTWSGESHDGASFAAAAAERGAVAMVGESCLDAPLPCLSAAEPRALLGPLASRLYGHPDRELTMVGITGTNGKSTVVALVAAVLDAAGVPAARFGTLGYRFGDLEFPSGRTTPEASDLFRMLRESRAAGACGAVMEVSSHALVQGRVACAGFDVGVFLNLTRDHLDFHGDMEAYFEAKAALFRQLKAGGRAVVNVDDPRGAELAERLPGAVGFGAEGSVRYLSVAVDDGGIRGRVASPAGEIAVESRLLGGYNAENLLAAAATGVACGAEAEAIAAGLAAVGPLPGRMERVDRGQPFLAVVDFAHTDGALRAAISSLRDLGPGPIVAVVGCGGERDRGKRRLMGAAAAELADVAILTSDNPRGEDPLAILAEVEAGAAGVVGARYEVVADRREAIRRAVALAEPGARVLVAGKGHERYQELAGRRIPFVDQDEIARAIEERFGPEDVA
ncbi:MAG: UDP-N-acetylmuramoyl-L-alanyl-D-glutamate--2,6-diaminopimelate ligase [Thermoanaerobaculia bacterium]|nr:UDP-N-acetylmuramoyl-L-alanyl-D-glutamate--2,6-diaminopimelate ligase [Thermoanaerobaculia bacterium]